MDEDEESGVVPPDFVESEGVEVGAGTGSASNFAYTSRRALGSGLPRRRRGRFGSAIGSSDDDLLLFSDLLVAVLAGFAGGDAPAAGADAPALPDFCSSFG